MEIISETVLKILARTEMVLLENIVLNIKCISVVVILALHTAPHFILSVKQPVLASSFFKCLPKSPLSF